MTSTTTRGTREELAGNRGECRKPTSWKAKAYTGLFAGYLHLKWGLSYVTNRVLNTVLWEQVEATVFQPNCNKESTNKTPPCCNSRQDSLYPEL